MRFRSSVIRSALAASALCVLGGCAQYAGVVRPVSHLSSLSPELENLTDAKIEMYLKNSARPAFPTVVAVAKLAGGAREAPTWQVIEQAEAQGWRNLTEIKDPGGKELVSQVQLVNRMLVPERVTLKGLRDAAALLHAPVLLVYTEEQAGGSGLNELAMAYWTIVGLFVVPGNTVGNYCVEQALLVDTRSGVVLASVEGEAKKEEKVLPGAVGIASDRTSAQARSEAFSRLQSRVAEALLALSSQPPVSRPGQGA